MSKDKEEAERIVEMFRNADYQDLSIHGLKSISILHIDELISELKNLHPYCFITSEKIVGRVFFLEGVKQEIEKL